jgi:hypothetical protein
LVLEELAQTTQQLEIAAIVPFFQPLLLMVVGAVIQTEAERLAVLVGVVEMVEVVVLELPIKEIMVETQSPIQPVVEVALVQ